MNSIQAITQDDQKVVEFSENPGRRLRVQRQSRGIEVERIAAQLHLRVAAVEALEQDRYQDLPGPVFVAGYLRNYARLVGLDPEPLIAAYRAANPAVEATGLRVSSLPRQEIGSGHILVRLISLGLFAAVIAMLVLWWQNRADLLSSLPPGDAAGLPLATPAGRPAGDRTRESAAKETGPASTALPLPAPAGAQPGPDNPTGPGRPPTSPTEAPPVPAATTAPDTVRAGAAAPATPAAGATPNPTEVAVTFSGTSWINVRDAKGSAVLNGQMHNGDTRVLTGNPPYSFAIGNAKAVQITVGGRPIDLTGRYRGNSARFKFDPRNPE